MRYVAYAGRKPFMVLRGDSEWSAFADFYEWFSGLPMKAHSDRAGGVVVTLPGAVVNIVRKR